MATAKQRPYSVGWAPGIMSNCFNRDSWFGFVGAGRDLSFLSQLKPELPGEVLVQRMQSCHLISAYCDYLFKTPVTLWKRGILKGREGQTEKRRKKSGRVPERLLNRLFWSKRSPYSCKLTQGWWHYTIPSNAEHLLHLQKSPNLSVPLCCDLWCFVSSNWFTNRCHWANRDPFPDPTTAEPALFHFCPMVHLYFCNTCSLHDSLLIDMTWIKHWRFKNVSTLHTGITLYNQDEIWLSVCFQLLSESPACVLRFILVLKLIVNWQEINCKYFW